METQREEEGELKNRRRRNIPIQCALQSAHDLIILCPFSCVVNSCCRRAIDEEDEQAGRSHYTAV